METWIERKGVLRHKIKNTQKIDFIFMNLESPMITLKQFIELQKCSCILKSWIFKNAYDILSVHEFKKVHVLEKKDRRMKSDKHK